MLVIRKATQADVPVILHLVRELALYERDPDAVVATEADYVREGFGDDPAFEVLLVDDAGTTIGFALFFFTFSTWAGARCLFLEDLFVTPEARGKGAGVLLMKTLAKRAVDAGCKRFVWNVLDWNKPAIDFYERLGAEILPDWRSVRLAGDALATFAAK